jgi:hypothetical protein
VLLSREEISDSVIDSLSKEVNRVLKMFYLHMKVKGQLKPFREDYFV